MSLQTLTLNLSLNVHIGADGTATMSLNTDDNRPIMPAQPIVEAPKQQKRSAPVAEPKPELKPATIVTQEQEQSVQVTATKAFDDAASTAPAVTPPPPPPPPVQPAPTAPVAQPAVTPPPPPPPPVAQVAQVAQTQPAVTPPPPPPPPVQPAPTAPVTQAQPAVTPPPPPPPPVGKTPSSEELQQAYEAQKAWTPRPPEPEPTLAEVNGYMPQPMATQPPPSPAVDEAAVTRDSNIRATAAALFGGHH